MVASEQVPLLPVSARRAARERVDAVMIIDQDADPAVCHGDFGPHNLLWADDREVTGVFDLDHALGNFGNRHDRGTLFDPDGRRSPIRS